MVDHLLVGGHNLLQLVNIGPSHVGDLGLVLEEDEGRHSSDLRKQIPLFCFIGNNLKNSHLVLGSNILAIINVNLQDDHVAHGLGNLLEMWCDHLAWSTPTSRILLNQYELN